MVGSIKFSFKVLLTNSFHTSAASTQEPSDANVTSTILFDKGFIIAVGFDLNTLDYRFSEGRFHFEVETRSESIWRAPKERISINDSGYRSSFALETFKGKPGDRSRDTVFCKTNSNPKMAHLFDACEGKIRMRTLTIGEQRRIQLYRNELASKFNGLV